MNNPYYINTGLGNVYKSGGSFKKYKKAVKKLYDAYLWGSPETELTKKEYKKYKKDLWEGLNQSKEVLASLNKEELKHPTNGQLVESYNNDNEIPLDYNYNVFNTARRDREQALLDAYNYNQSLLTPGQKAANSVAARDDYRGLAYLLNGIALSPFVLSGAGLNLTKGLYNLLNNPLVDTALTAHGVMKAPSNVKEGIKNIKEGAFGKGMLDLGFTALDMLGAGRLAKRIAPAAVNFSKNIPYAFKPLPESDVLPDVFEALRKAHKSNQFAHPGIYRSMNPRERLVGRSDFDYVRRPEVRYSLNPGDLFSRAAYNNNEITISPKFLFKERNIIKEDLPHEYEHHFQKYYYPKLSVRGNDYWVFNPKHPLRDTLYLFDKERGPFGRRIAWDKSPDELDAEMVRWKYNMSIPFSNKYLNLESDLQDKFINETMDRFNFNKEDAQKILLDLSQAGYFANGGSLDGSPEKPPVNVDLDYMWNSNQKLGNNRMMNRENMEQLDNFFIEKGLSLPQRQALLYTILQESGADSLGAHGNGYYGLVGWSGPRYNAIKDKSLMGQAEHLYNTLFNGNGKVDWNHGGDGSGYASWTDAQKAFLNAQDFDTAMKALTYGYVRPSDENKLYRIEYGPKHFAAPVSEEQTPVVLDLNTKEGFDDPKLLKKINKDMNEYTNGGTIHIKPENKGKFTAAAKRAGKSVQGYASQILANPDNYSSTLVKRANFARNAAKWHACGGKLYPDGGPIDPPWASFVPSQPREPQVVRPQQQANPYLLGLSAGMGRNEAAKYSTAAQTPEFQQGYYDGQAQVVASEAAKAGRAPIVEPGIEVVSPVLSVLPGTGDVKDFADIADYYYNTGDLATSLGLATLTVASPVQGVGKLGKLSNEARALKMLQDAEYGMKHYAERIAEKPKPLGSIDYKIPKGEKVPELSPISKRLEIPYAPEGHSKFKKEAGEQFDKALNEQSKKIKGKDSKKSIGATAQERVAQIETDPSDMTRWQKAKAWTFKPWKERSKLRKGVEGTIGTSLGLSAVGYGIKKGFDIAENAKKSVDYNFNPASARPDSVTAARYYEDFIKDSLDNEANGDIYLDLGYPRELVDSVKNDNLKKLFEKYREYLPYKTQ